MFSFVGYCKRRVGVKTPRKADNKKHEILSELAINIFSNSHFFVKISSLKLENQSRVSGQRMIYKVLEKELKEYIHALRIQIIYQKNG